MAGEHYRGVGAYRNLLGQNRIRRPLLRIAASAWLGSLACLALGVQPPAPAGGGEPPEPEDPTPVQPEAPAQKPAPPTKSTVDLETEESLARFQSLLRQRPFHGPAFEGLVKYFIDRGKLKDLLAEYTAKVAALPDDVPLRIVLARLHLRAGDAPAAGALLDKIEHLPPDMARMASDLLVLKAEVYQRTGNNAAAENVLKEAQEQAPSVSEKIRLGEALADLYVRDNRKDDAVGALNALAAQFPDNYLHQRRIAGALEQRGLHEAALERYRATLPLAGAETDRKCEVLREIGQVLERLNRRDEAIASYTEAAALLASDHWLQKDLQERIVALYRSANRLEDLAKYCQDQIKRTPEQTSTRILLADVQAAMGKPEAGKQTLADAVELFPKDLPLSAKRIEFLERQGDTEGVGAEYQRIIGQNPADTELYIAYGQSLANNRRVEGARNQWRHVLGARVDDPALAVRLGALFEAYELYDDAAEAYERAITANAKLPDAYAALNRLWLTRGDAEKAAGTLDRMGSANPDDGAVQAALAQALRNMGKTPEALRAITRACELLPDQVRYHQVRSDLLIQSGQLEEGLAVRRAMIDRMTNPVQRAEAIATLVSMYSTGDRMGALKEGEERQLKEKPGDSASLLILARIADTERDFPEMRRRLESLLAADPGNETAQTQMAKLYDATGDINAATDVYTRLVQRYPARARQFYEAIVDLKLRYGDRAGAIETLQSMAREDQGSAVTQSAVADQLVRMGEPERALPFFESTLKIQPDRHESRLEYGKALVEAGRLEDALPVFRAVGTQRADTDRAFEAIGRMHDVASQLGKLEELTDDLQQQVEADPSNTLVARAIAELYVRELEYTRALEMLNLVLKHNPRDVDLALTRAEVLRRLARFDEAVEEYQRVLRFPQTDRDFVLGELGKTYFESGQVDQARRLWRQVQNKLYAGTLLKNNGLLEEAIGAFEEGIRLKPDEYALHRNLIQTLEAAGRTPDALKAARRLLDLEPSNAMNIERLAEACVRTGDRAGAAQVASRLFSAAVGPDKSAQHGGGRGGYQSMAGAMYQSQSSQYASPYYSGGGQVRSNLDRGIQFFVRNGLMAELDEVLAAQMAAQGDNAVLKETAADLYSNQLNKPEQSLAILRELESATFPLERQQWLGQCSQRDFMRIRQFGLIASKPALRDRELARLEGTKVETLGRDDLLELAVIRNAQGNAPGATELLQRAVAAAPDDTLALGVLTDLLVAAEKFDQAEPHARKLVELLAVRREQMLAGTIERVRRDFVRSLPLEFQLRVNENLLADIAEKWTLGSAWSWWEPGSVQAIGYLRAKLTLGTVCAETNRMEEARGIWRELAPKRGPDADRWTLLGDMAQLHNQEDLAFEFYQQALRAAKALAGDPLMRQVYTSNTAQMSWYGEQGSIDKSFSAIVEAFAKRDGLVELYDFLRDTDQQQRARRVAEQYKLSDKLIPIYEKRVQEAATAFHASHENPLQASVPYFAEVCKLAELVDRAGDSGAAGAEGAKGGWDAAQKVYEAYLADFPDELELLALLGEVAEARQKTNDAIAWERKVLECKTRLSKRAREWGFRELSLVPARPQPLGKERNDQWTWVSRWSRNRGGYGGSRDDLDRTPSWMRLAQLYLTADNTIAAADAMQRAVADAADALQRALAEAGPMRDSMVQEVLAIIQERQLTGKMLPVLRTLAVFAPSDEQVQLAYAESLDTAGRKELALEVCNRMLRRGVSDLRVLAEVRRRVASLSPAQAAPKEATLATLEADAAADKANLKARLRLAKAYYYSLQLDKAQEVLGVLATDAPHLEDVHDLLVDVYTLRGDTDKLIEALKTKISRLSDEQKRRAARWRLVNELLGAGRSDEALAVVKDLGDPRDPTSYTRIGALLHYFGRHDEAIACFQQGAKSKPGGRGYMGREGADFSVALSLALQGDFAGAGDKILAAVDEQSSQQVQYGGMYAMFDQGGASPFAPLEQVFALYPDLAAEISKRLNKRHEEKPADPQAVKLLMAFDNSTGRPDLARALLDQMSKDNTTDQALVMKLIDQAERDHDTPGAIALAERFIAQTPKPKLPPGVPPQYAGMMVLQSPRTMMVCKLGDLYWDRAQEGDKDKAFETYRQIIDEKMDDTRLAYATICLIRGRAGEARQLVDKVLATQQVKPPNLLMFKAFIAAMDGQVDNAFDAMAEAAAPGAEVEDRFGGGGGGGSPLAGLSSLAERGPGLPDKFAAFVQNRIKTDPNDWENYRILADAYRRAGRPKEALAVMAQAESVSTLTQQALQQRLAWTRSEMTVTDRIALYEKLIELTERTTQASSGGMSRFGGRRGGYEADSGAQTYRDQLGSILWESGEKERAEKLWTARMNVQSADAHLRLGRLYEQSGDRKKAEAEYQRACDLDPDNVSAHTAAAEAAFQHDPPDHQAVLSHMLECFARRNGVAASPTPRYSFYSGYDDGNRGGDSSMSRWALALSQDPRLATYLADPAIADRAGECRIMLASLTGDWPALEPLLRERIEAGTPDVMIWTLWSRLQQRKGDLAGAAKSLEFLRRAALTSIGEHREQLKLVLAGKQLKEAVAGTRQAQPGGQPMPGGPGASAVYGAMSYGGYSGYDDYGGPRGDSSLPTLYIRLGDFSRAERLYLISSGEGAVQARLPSLASLMWQQKNTGPEDKAVKGGKERALELMRLALSLPADRYGSRGTLERYAAMLADTGPAGQAQAIELLVRAYRFNSGGDQNPSYYAAMYSRGPDQEMEQGEEQNISHTLITILQHAGVLDQTIAKLSQQSVADPDDPRLAKLVLALQKQGRKWAELRDALGARAEALTAAHKPVPVAEMLEQFHAECQLSHWDAALVLLAKLRKDAPRQADQWNAHEAFVQLMRNDPAKAQAAAEPLLVRSGQQDRETTPTAGLTVLAAAQANDRLADYLNKLMADGEIDSLGGGGKELLFRALLAQKRWGPALSLTLDEFWKEPDVLRSSSRWWRALNLLSQRAAAAGAPLVPSTARPEDAALVTLVKQGPEEGVKAFDALGAQPSLNALRGLLLASTLAGDDAKAALAAGAIVDWLQAHRNEAWYSNASAPIQRLAGRTLEQMGQTGTAQVPMSFGFSSQLSQLLQPQDGGGPSVVTYSPLRPAYERTYALMLARNGDADKLRALLDTHALASQDPSEAARYGYNANYFRTRTSAYYGGYGGGGRYGGGEDEGQDPDLPSPEQRATSLRRILFSANRLNLLQPEYDRLGRATPTAEEIQREEAIAASAKGDAAASRRERAKALLAEMLAADTPDLGSTNYDYYSWYWYSSNDVNQDASKIKQALLMGGAYFRDESDDPNASVISGEQNTLWEIAIADPAVAADLLRCESLVGADWGSTQTARQLVSYYRAKRQPEKVIALVEKTATGDNLVRSPLLGEYIGACYKTKATARITPLLESAKRVSSSLENDLDVARLVMLRVAGQDQEGEQLETRLLAKCVTEPRNEHRPVADLEGASGGGEYDYSGQDDFRFNPYAYSAAYSRYGYNRFRYRGQDALGDLSTVDGLAQALGVRYESKVGPEDLTITSLRSAYQRYGLHAHAARMLDREIAQAGAPEERLTLILAKAESQQKAKQTDAARQTSHELETALQRELKASPAQARTHALLARMYLSKAWDGGKPDYAKALEALGAARAIDPSYDASRTQAVRCLYELGRHADAWSATLAAMREGTARMSAAEPMYYAGLSACRAGDPAAKESGKRLLRQAVYRYPDSALASKAQEFIDER